MGKITWRHSFVGTAKERSEKLIEKGQCGNGKCGFSENSTRELGERQEFSLCVNLSFRDKAVDGR